MKIKRFVAKDIRLAMRMVKEELGADAVIMSNRTVDDGVEIVAARDFDEQVIQHKLEDDKKPLAKSEKSVEKLDLIDFEAKKNNAHLVSSPRKVGGDGRIPQRRQQRNIDKYVGYAEKIQLASSHARAKLNEQKIPLKQPPLSAAGLNKKDMETIKQQLSQTFVEEMRNEINSLKSAMNNKLAEISWSQGIQHNVVRMNLLRRFAHNGLSKKLANKIANRLDQHKDVESAFEKAKEMLSRVLPIADDNLLEYGGIIALVGPTGVGKTTTIAKLAAKYILQHGSRQVALITTDNYRIGAHEQLTTYGRLLDIPVRVAANAEELRHHINSFNDRRLILIDTAGMSQRDMRLAEQIQTLQQEDVPIKTYLVMSAATQYKAMNEIIDAFKVFEPESSILTKLDETATLGSTLSAIIEQQMPVSFLTNGQQVPEDIFLPDASALIAECMREPEPENQFNHESSLEDLVAEGYA